MCRWVLITQINSKQYTRFNEYSQVHTQIAENLLYTPISISSAPTPWTSLSRRCRRNVQPSASRECVESNSRIPSLSGECRVTSPLRAPGLRTRARRPGLRRPLGGPSAAPDCARSPTRTPHPSMRAAGHRSSSAVPLLALPRGAPRFHLSVTKLQNKSNHTFTPLACRKHANKLPPLIQTDKKEI